MLAKAAYDGEESLLNKVLIVYSERIEGLNPQKSLIEYYINGNRDTYKSEYPRYWHGYLVLLKPFLFLFDYGMIRTINGISQTLINILLIFVLYKSKLKQYIFPYILSICFIMPIAIAKSLQFSSIFYIFSIATIVLILNYNKWKDTVKIFYFFLLIGIFTSYFDFLTYPIATFGVPFIFLLSMKEKTDRRSEVVLFLKAFFFWGVGYVGMWAGKWIVASLLSDINVIEDALKQVAFRLSATDEKGTSCSVLHVWNVNISAFVKTPVMLVAIGYIISKINQIVKKQKMKELIEQSFRYAIIVMLPIVWYVVTRNHSWPHAYFTCKALIVTAFGGMFFCKSARRLMF